MSLFGALHAAADALQVYQQSLTVAQNNVANASTPGYARQVQGLRALVFDPTSGLAGGVAAEPVQTTRDPYAEQAVQRAVTSLGTAEQQVDSLSPLVSNFNISGDGGIPGALNALFQAFNQWSVAPNDGPSRQGVLNTAQDVGRAFNEAGNTLAKASSDADIQLQGLVDQV